VQGIRLRDEAATLDAGARLARSVVEQPGPVVVTLAGPLGSGKTTLARGLLRALGVDGPVRSPSYTLVEEHAASGWDVLHLDLYRLDEGAQLDEFGLRERHAARTLMLVEWPERAAPGALPPVDLALSLALPGTAAAVGHVLDAQASTPTGTALLRAFLTAPHDDSTLSP
jgi:tRNA threonylcarbamoyladenosine biosynthesis protein TsaE